MKILIVNEYCGHTSTGKICTDIADRFISEGHDVRIAFGRDNFVPDKYRDITIRVGNDFDVRIHGIKTRLLDAHGLGSKGATKRFLKWVESYSPNMIWLHNIHGYYINYEILFSWIKAQSNIQIKWTLHDCWAMTGHCAHFSYINCDKWRTGCKECKQLDQYPASLLVDNSKRNYQKKKSAFCGVEDLEIITPSEWLASIVKQSFLKVYPVRIEHNQIDTSVFSPTPSDIRGRMHLEGMKVILGVANAWNDRKGLYDFFQLSKLLRDNEQIVLVGLSDRQLSILPSTVLGIKRTENQRELAQLYSAADIFFNPTYEDTYPTVNLEAEACGTPVITYDTCGCRETLHNKRSKVIPVGKYELLLEYLRGNNENSV